MAGLSKNFSKLSVKHIQIDKAHLQMVIVISVATVVFVFSAFAVQALFKQISYQNKVIGLRSKANKTLTSNVAAAQALETSYNAFNDSSESVLGNNTKNAKIVLNALPSKYDFPAVVSSVSYLAKISGVGLSDISGNDEELTAEQQSANPQVVEIPFSVTVAGSYASVQKFIENVQKSIRPFEVLTTDFRGSDATMSATISMKTFYQPEKQLQLQEEVVSNTKAKAKKTTTTGTTEVKK